MNWSNMLILKLTLLELGVGLQSSGGPFTPELPYDLFVS